VTGQVRRLATIVNPKGMHIRPSRKFVLAAQQFDAKIFVRFSEKTIVTADSVLNLLEFAPACGDQIEIIAEGTEADAAVEALCDLVAAGFYDDNPSK
jgi:phosphocarrier protein